MTPEEEKNLMIGVLMLKFNKSEEEVLKSYNQFYADNPDGSISQEKYVASIKVVNWNYPVSCNVLQIHSKNTMMAESLFRVFDEDKSGTLSFEEYFQASQVGRPDNQGCLIIFTNS